MVDDCRGLGADLGPFYRDGGADAPACGDEVGAMRRVGQESAKCNFLFFLYSRLDCIVVD